NLVEPDVWGARYEEINAWERALVDDGVRILKFALMVSYEEQGARLMERLDRPDKHWKYSPGDLKTRAKWDAYQEAYADVFRLTSTEYAPWYVLPADRKWYPRLAVTEILTRTLEEMNLDWPKATFDVEEQRAALAATMRR
ncbi:MAG: polyphosphate kinase 2 family protein, partial [Thermoleophilia bacterium]|nr:polyphosphate kinase 2 family protein [Thermoleophilia bacterium]